MVDVKRLTINLIFALKKKKRYTHFTIRETKARKLFSKNFVFTENIYKISNSNNKSFPDKTKNAVARLSFKNIILLSQEGLYRSPFVVKEATGVPQEVSDQWSKSSGQVESSMSALRGPNNLIGCGLPEDSKIARFYWFLVKVRSEFTPSSFHLLSLSSSLALCLISFFLSLSLFLARYISLSVSFSRVLPTCVYDFC